MPPKGKAEEGKAEEDPNKVLLKLQVKNGSSACFIDMADTRVSAEQVRCRLRRGRPQRAPGDAGRLRADRECGSAWHASCARAASVAPAAVACRLPWCALQPLRSRGAGN